ncbi:MAG: 5-oxoprolinase subunit PxpA [Woeseiaceae bacterium]|nr:5-oxoprolinase subunit PxpA [Woeseiaceae bacterium]
MTAIDLNADLGEGGPADTELMEIVSSCSIACGGHAGDAGSMSTALRLARQHGVAAGAHPSYPDREGFGRRSGFLAGPKLQAALHDQVRQLSSIAGEQGVSLRHLKPHGALYHDANNDAAQAAIIVALAAEFSLALVGPPDGELRDVAANAGVGYVAEGFADRAYGSDGRLVPRSEAGAVFSTPEQSVRQALSLALHQATRAANGDELSLRVDTLCVHGDTPDAVALASAVRAALIEHGVSIRAFEA